MCHERPEGLAECLRLFGAWALQPSGALRFVAVKPPTTEDVEALVVEIAERCEQLLARLGYGAEDEGEDPDPDDGQLLLQAASCPVDRVLPAERACIPAPYTSPEASRSLGSDPQRPQPSPLNW